MSDNTSTLNIIAYNCQRNTIIRFQVRNRGSLCSCRIFIPESVETGIVGDDMKVEGAELKINVFREIATFYLN